MNSLEIEKIKGLEKKEYYTNCDLSKVSTEGRLIAVNKKYLAFSWKKIGEIKILNSSKPGYIKEIQPHIKGIKENIFDLEFSPFNNNILASSYANNSVLLWDIPENNFKENLTKESLTYNKHAGRVNFINFNPIKEDLMVSADYSKEIHIWSISKGETCKILKTEDGPTLISWSPNGNLIGVTTKNQFMNIFESRSDEIVCNLKIADSTLNTKFAWIDDNLFITSNGTKDGNQELKLWDIRNLKNKLSEQNEQTSIQLNISRNKANIRIPYVNNELKLIYTTVKGDKYINVYDYSEGILKKKIDFQSSENSVFSILFNKKDLDKNKNEIDRFARYTYKKVYYVSFLQKNNTEDKIYHPTVEYSENTLNNDKKNENFRLIKNNRNINRERSQAQFKTINHFNTELKEDQEKSKKDYSGKTNKKFSKTINNRKIERNEELSQIKTNKTELGEENYEKGENIKLKKIDKDFDNNNKKINIKNSNEKNINKDFEISYNIVNQLYKYRNKKIEKMYNDLKEKYINFKKRSKSIQKNYKEISKKYLEVTKNNKAINNEYNKMKKRYIDLENKNKEFKNKYKELENKIIFNEEKNEEINNNKFEEEIGNNFNGINNYNLKEIYNDNIIKKYNEIQQIKTQFENKIKEFEYELNEKNKKELEEYNINKEFKNKYNEMKVKYSQEVNKNEELEDKYNEIKEKYLEDKNNKEKEIISLKNEIKEKEQEIKNLKIKNLEDILLNKQEIEKNSINKMNELNNSIDEYKNIIDEKMKILEKNKEIISRFEEDKKELKNKLNEKDNKILNIQNEISNKNIIIKEQMNI